MDAPGYRRGIALFNAGHFFDAHEALEDVWREARGAEKLFLQALIQVAVGLHHHAAGNRAGARSLLARGARKLDRYPGVYGGLDVAGLRQVLARWEAALAAEAPAPPLPRLEPAAATRSAPGGDRLFLPVKTASTPKKPRQSSQRSTNRGGEMRRIPQLDLQRQYAGIRAEIAAALARVCDSQRFILGEEVAACEREIAAFTGAGTTVACASGTDALWLALVAAGVQPGDEVLTTAFSFIASATAIARAGARPVLVDIDPLTFNLDPRQAEHKVHSALTSRLRAILAVHLYGQCAQMDALQNLAAEAKLVLLEDAAQAFGAAWRGQRAGSLGAAAALSFYPTKNLGAFGDGGAVTTSEPGLAERMLSLRNHGMRERYRHDEMGWNSRLDALQAAILRVKLKHVVEWNQRRNQIAETYGRLFAQAGLTGRESAVPPAPVQLPHTLAEAYHAYHQYVIRAQRRDELRRFLAERGVGTEVYYPIPMHLQQCFLYLGYTEGSFPEAERAAREVLALPMFPELQPDEQAYVVAAIAQFYS